MSLAVDRILERRARSESRRPEATSLLVAFLLHALALAAVFILPRLTPPPPPLTFVPVQIIPAQALGVRHPAAPPKAEKPAPPKPEPAAEEAPEPPKPEPEPAPPKPKPSREEAPVLPDKPEKKPKPTSQSEMPRPAPPAPDTPGRKPTVPRPQGEAEGEAGRKGAPTGKPEGTSAFGSQIAGLDNPDFKFGVYIDQLLSAIDAKWARPPLGNDVQAVISFRIQRDGSITDLQVSRSSGYNSFDLAALRAVQNASPFAPLPRGYREDSLGVNLIVR